MAVSAIVDLETDVLPFLGMGTPADGGALLQVYIDGVTPVIEDVVGHVIAYPVTDELYDGGDTTIYLRETPVASIQSIIEVIGLVPYTLTEQPVGYPVDNFGYTLDDPDIGRVTRRSAGSQEFEFYDNVGNVSVSYTAGVGAVPGNVKLATLELLKIVYQPEQEAFGAKSSFVPAIDKGAENDTEIVATPAGFLIPRRIYQMLTPSDRPPAFA